MQIIIRLRPFYVAYVPLAEVASMTGTASDYKPPETQKVRFRQFYVARRFAR